jgi:hypothetical protein
VSAAARDLVRRMRALQERRHALTAAKDHVRAHAALDLAVSLVDAADRATLGGALLHATNPASVPPVPVVLGPQDAADGGLSIDELLAMVAAYATGCTDWGRAFERKDAARCHEIERALEGSHADLRAALERLCGAVPPVELGGGR